MIVIFSIFKLSVGTINLVHGFHGNIHSRRTHQRQRCLSEFTPFRHESRNFLRFGNRNFCKVEHYLFSLKFSCLLHHVKGPTGFADLRTVYPDDRPCTIYTTYTEAAQKLGLLESDDIFYEAMKDACVENSNFKQLQRYFAMLLFHSRPSNPLKFFEDFIDHMNPPFSVNNPNMLPKSKEIRGGEVLRNLEYFFRGLGTSCLYVVFYSLNIN